MTTRELDLAQHVARLQDRVRQLEQELAVTEDALTEAQVTAEKNASYAADLFAKVYACVSEVEDERGHYVAVGALREALGLEP